MRDSEFLGVHAFGASFFERRYAPVHRALKGGSSGNASANFIGQAAEVRFQGRRLERLRNQTIRDLLVRIAIACKGY